MPRCDRMDYEAWSKSMPASSVEIESVECSVSIRDKNAMVLQNAKCVKCDCYSSSGLTCPPLVLTAAVQQALFIIF